MRSLGTSVEDIENLTRPIALLSQALGEDAGGVAATLKKTLNMFQATTEEADRFANILTGAVNESALTLQDLGTALGYVGPLGRQLGVSFEETAALLGILADNGFKANKAGTGLRQFFISAAKDGRPFNEFLEDIANRNLDVTEAVQLFNKTGASQALILGENVERFKQLSQELTQSDRLFIANAKQMATTQGQLDLLASAYDKFSTKLGEVITQSDIFLSLIAVFDRQSAGQASAYRIIADSAEETQMSINELTKAQRRFGEGSQESISDLELVEKAFDSLGETVDITRVDFLFEFNKELEKTGNVQEALTELGKTWNNELNEAALTIQGLIDITYAQSKSLDDAYIAQEANSESVKRYKREYQGLLSLTKDGINVDKEKAQLTKQIDAEISALQEASFKAAADRNFEEQNIIVKRISLLKQQKTDIDELAISEEILAEQRKKADKEAQDRFKTELSNYIERIKETEKAIADLPEGVSDKVFMQQVDLLTGFFGSSEDIIAQATDRFGADSDFVKALIKALKDATKKVSVELPKDPFADTVLDTSALEAFNEDNIDIDGVTKVAKSLKEKFGEAFKGLDIGEIIKEGIETAADALSDFNDVALENTTNRLEAEKDAISNRYSVEEDILRSQLDNQLITESQFRTKQLELRRSQIAKENSIDKKIFDSEKKKDKQDAGIDYLVALASIVPTLIAYDKTADPVSVLTKAAITGGLATVAFGAEIAAINQRKFFPKQFAEGGMVNGPSHDQGGVPFSVQGTAGYEMEGGEFIVNKRATAMHRDLLERINDSHKVRPLAGAYKFAQGGLVTATS